VGGRVALFVLPNAAGRSQTGVLAAVRDVGRARLALATLAARAGPVQQRASQGIHYSVGRDGIAVGIVRGYAVIAPEPAFQQVITAATRTPLAHADKYTLALSTATRGGVGLLYVEPQNLLALLHPHGGLTAADLTSLVQRLTLVPFRPIVAQLRVVGRALVLDVVPQPQLPVAYPPPPGSRPRPGAVARAALSPLGLLPAALAAGVGIPGLGARLTDVFNPSVEPGVPHSQLLLVQHVLEQRTGLQLHRDLLSWMGDASGFVLGTDPATAGGALVIASQDPAASSRALPRIRRALLRLHLRVGPRPAGLGAAGFSVRVPGMRLPVEVLDLGSRVVVALGARAAHMAAHPGRTLGQSPAYRSAVTALSGLPPSVFFTAPAGMNLLRRLIAGSPTLRVFAPYLGSLTYVAYAGAYPAKRFVFGVR
jgi:hypothetical protein